MRLAAGPTSDGVPVIGVLEAALIIEAGMDAVLDEVWCTYVSEEEAVRRIKERNGLSGMSPVTSGVHASEKPAVAFNCLVMSCSGPCP